MYLNNHYPFSPLADLRLGSRLLPWCPWPCWALPGRWWKPYAPPRRCSKGLIREYVFFGVVEICWVKNEWFWSAIWHMWCIHLGCTTRRVRVCPHFYQFFLEHGLAAAAAVCTRRRRETWISWSTWGTWISWLLSHQRSRTSLEGISLQGCESPRVLTWIATQPVWTVN